MVTLWLNDRELDYDQDEAFVMVMSVADGSSRLTEFTQWFADRVRPAQPGGSG